MSAALFTCAAALAAAPRSELTHRLVGSLLRPFLPHDPPKRFQDHWWRAMPSDDEVPVADPYWWAKGVGSARAYLTRFWDRLLDLPGARLHWGEHISDVGQQCGKTLFGPDHVRAMYPRFQDWLDLRRQLDSEQVFVSLYWRRHLGL